MHDVIIIGAGFTGLSAALELTRRGKDVVVLEARGRVGGRVESQVNALGERVDTGGQFACDDMVNVRARRSCANAMSRWTPTTRRLRG
ncbi:MAG: FAD-dependent oxidoreductase [Mesorhizobium sp.]|nr:FAD-dependent oxidoreductase [Mesorhizobium sp.]